MNLEQMKTPQLTVTNGQRHPYHTTFWTWKNKVIDLETMKGLQEERD